MINAILSLYANADYEFELGHTDGGKRQSLRGAVGSDTAGNSRRPEATFRVVLMIYGNISDEFPHHLRAPEAP